MSPESGSRDEREPVKAMAAAFHRAMNHSFHGGGWDHNDGDLAHRLIDELAAEGFTLALSDPPQHANPEP